MVRRPPGRTWKNARSRLEACRRNPSRIVWRGSTRNLRVLETPGSPGRTCGASARPPERRTLRFLLLHRGPPKDEKDVEAYDARLRQAGVLEHLEQPQRVREREHMRARESARLQYGAIAAGRPSDPAKLARALPQRPDAIVGLRVLRAESVDAAIAHARAVPHGMGTVEVYPIVDPLEVPFGSSHPHESLGYAVHFVKPLPARAHTRRSRFLVTFEGTSFERPPHRASLLEAGRTLFEMAARGLLVGGEGLRDCVARFRLESHGTRREWTARVRVTPQLFGYLVLRADSPEEAHEWAMACASLSGHQGGEIVELEAPRGSDERSAHLVSTTTERPEPPRS